MNNNVLVTGGAGYIGSHACKALKRAGCNPITFDNLVTGWKEAVKYGPFENGNLLNKAENSDLNTENIKVKECYADGGPHMKRFRAASMGRISKLNKPTAHLTVVVADNNN